MKIIKKLSDYIHEEIHDAGKYAEAAVLYKEDYPDVAAAMYVLSMEEIHHMQILHNLVTQIIADYRKEKGEPPADMLAIYNYVHEKLINEEKEVKVMQQMYKD